MTQAEAKAALAGTSYFPIRNGKVLVRDVELLRLYDAEVQRRTKAERLRITSSAAEHKQLVNVG